jgi:hypothetical protein
MLLSFILTVEENNLSIWCSEDLMNVENVSEGVIGASNGCNEAICVENINKYLPD